jgi:protocatechuate 3,4-dioxygenase beta subunit
MRNRSRGRVAFVAALAVAAFGIAAAGQGLPPPPPPPPPPTGTGFGAPDPSASSPSVGTGLLAGRVVDAVTGRPVTGVSISVGGGVGATFSYSMGPMGQPQIGGPGRPQSSGGAPRQVLTDSDGRFVFYSLSKGNYVLRTTSPAAYLNGGYGQNRPSGPVQPIALATDDTRIGDLTIRIWKTGVISGTVTDEIGEPVVGIGVSAFRRTAANGQFRHSQVNSAQTDDRGAYRFAGLGPGDYVIGVSSIQTTMPVSTAEAYAQAISSGNGIANSEVYRSLSNSGVFPNTNGYRIGDLLFSSSLSGRGGGSSSPAPADDGRVFAYPPTFHPAAASASQATAIKLGSGDERSGVDLQLKLVPALRVSGTVVGPDGPMPNLGVKLFAGDTAAYTGPGFTNSESATTVSDGTGAFTFLGITPGQYTLRVARVPRPFSTTPPSNITTIEVSGPNGMMMMGMSSIGPGAMPPAPPPIPPDPTLAAAQSVSVGETDVTGLNLVLRPGARLAGRLQFDGTREIPGPAQLQRANVSITPLENRSFTEFPQVRVDAQGRFTTGGFAPGKYQINGASVPTLPTTGPPAAAGSGWTFKSATLNGRSLTDDPFDIAEEDIAGIVITFTDRTTQITGVVADSKGQPDKTADVVVLAADSQSWKDGLPNTRRIRAARASLTGVYEFSGLPPGEYYIAAVSGETTIDMQDPKFLESVSRVATRITLSDGEKKTQNLEEKAIH